MTTNALELGRLLNAAQAHSTKSDKFLEVIADILALEGQDGTLQALYLLRKLILEIQEQIEALPHDEDIKKVARQHLSPFMSIANYSQVHMNLEQAKSHFLKPEHLVGLKNLHMALSGHFNQTEFPEEAVELAKKFREIESSISGLELPDDAIRAIQTRVHQISVLLENANAFGPAEIKREIEALMGAIFVNAPKVTGRVKTVIAGVYGLAIAGLVLLQQVDGSMQSAISIEKNSEDFQKLIEGLADSEKAE